MGALHHLDVGCADSSIILADNSTFLIDCHDPKSFGHLLPSSKKIKGVFITHQHYDHFDGLEYLKEKGYLIDHIIHSPYVRRYGDNSVELDEWNSFNSLIESFEKKGTKIHQSYRQEDFSKAYWDSGGIQFRILGPDKNLATSDTRELHDACLVIHANLGERRCLFTGDASDANLNFIAKKTTNICNDILHASHHGSINGADLDFVKACNASYTVVSTKSGVYPNMPHDTAMQRYRNNTKEKVYRTDIDGSLKWTF